jgi:hypothetical protein
MTRAKLLLFLHPLQSFSLINFSFSLRFRKNLELHITWVHGIKVGVENIECEHQARTSDFNPKQPLMEGDGLQVLQDFHVTFTSGHYQRANARPDTAQVILQQQALFSLLP